VSVTSASTVPRDRVLADKQCPSSSTIHRKHCLFVLPINDYVPLCSRSVSRHRDKSFGPRFPQPLYGRRKGQRWCDVEAANKPLGWQRGLRSLIHMIARVVIHDFDRSSLLLARLLVACNSPYQD
jgi:hypothetical protein